MAAVVLRSDHPDPDNLSRPMTVLAEALQLFGRSFIHHSLDGPREILMLLGNRPIIR
jgi:hypothetical protein